MQTWILLFRAINVGGKNILKMAELRSGLTQLGFHDVATYIQSGNVVVRSTLRTAQSVRKKTVELVSEQHGFRPELYVLSREELAQAVDNNPFPAAASEPKSLHFFFLAKPVHGVDLTSFAQYRSASEKFQLAESIFYLHSPEGLSKSKLAARVEKLLGVSVTARNYRTVSKLLDMTAYP